MKEDYLWDKTGEDAEISRLENVLSAFRHEDSAVLVPKPVIVAMPEPKRGWFFSLRFAFAAGFAAVLLVSVGFLLRPDSEVANLGNIETELPAARPDPEKILVTDPPVTKTEQAPYHTTLTRPEPARTVKAEKISARGERKAVASRTLARRSSTALTAEEKYAYSQLMLALSITGSKLKIVKDAVNGTEAAHEGLDKSTR